MYNNSYEIKPMDSLLRYIPLSPGRVVDASDFKMDSTIDCSSPQLI
jgi:hypothetical protein